MDTNWPDSLLLEILHSQTSSDHFCVLPLMTTLFDYLIDHELKVLPHLDVESVLHSVPTKQG